MELCLSRLLVTRDFCDHLILNIDRFPGKMKVLHELINHLQLLPFPIDGEKKKGNVHWEGGDLR